MIETATNKMLQVILARFEERLQKYSDELDKIFRQLVEEVANLSLDFGEKLATNEKIIESFANRPPKSQENDDRRGTYATSTRSLIVKQLKMERK